MSRYTMQRCVQFVELIYENRRSVKKSSIRKQHRYSRRDRSPENIDLIHGNVVEEPKTSISRCLQKNLA